MRVPLGIYTCQRASLFINTREGRSVGRRERRKRERERKGVSWGLTNRNGGCSIRRGADTGAEREHEIRKENLALKF